MDIPKEIKSIIEQDPVVAACFKVAPTYTRALELSVIRLSEIKLGLIDNITQLHIDNSKCAVIK